MINTWQTKKISIRPGGIREEYPKASAETSKNSPLLMMDVNTNGRFCSEACPKALMRPNTQVIEEMAMH